MMWLFGFSLASLVAGNWLRRTGIERARANTYGSAAALAGQRRSSAGTIINVLGALSLLIVGLWTWL